MSNSLDALDGHVELVSRIEGLSAERRVEVARHSFCSRERTIWASRHPEEVPLLNGEHEWIAATLADNE